MGKIRKFAELGIRKITGGRDPINLVEEFILRLGHDPEKCARERTVDNARWMLTLREDEELEVLVEGLKKASETTIYMGINVVTVSLRGASDLLVAALEIADGLIGIKISLVGHYLVLSASLAADGISVEDLDYHYKLMLAQELWYKNALADEMGWESLPEG